MLLTLKLFHGSQHGFHGSQQGMHGLTHLTRWPVHLHYLQELFIMNCYDSHNVWSTAQTGLGASLDLKLGIQQPKQNCKVWRQPGLPGLHLKAIPPSSYTIQEVWLCDSLLIAGWSRQIR